MTFLFSGVGTHGLFAWPRRLSSFLPAGRRAERLIHLVAERVGVHARAGLILRWAPVLCIM